jgi:hypothetical protein
MLPFIIDDESRRRWKDAYQGLRRLYISTSDIENAGGIPLALHIAVSRSIFKDGNEDVVEALKEDIEELKPSFITLKVAFGAQFTDKYRPEQTQHVKDFIEAVGRFGIATGTPTHLFCENNDGIMAYGLGINTFSQPVDHKVLRGEFAPVVAPSLEDRYGRIYDYGSKDFVKHKTWLTKSEASDHASCALKCCKDKTYGVLNRMTLHDFYHYAATHLTVTRDQEIGEFVEAIKKRQVVQHLATKFNYK